MKTLSPDKFWLVRGFDFLRVEATGSPGVRGLYKRKVKHEKEIHLGATNQR
jgi:hypothetical protein